MLFRYLESRIVGTARTDSRVPPNRLLHFYWHFLSQHKPWYAAVIATMFCVAMMDLVIPISIGCITGLLQAEQPTVLLKEKWWLYSGLLAALLVIRPFMQMSDLAIRLNVVVPGMPSLIRWQTHWFLSRQSWSFFQNDFAGRLSNRVMQTASALRDSVLSTIRAVMYISIYGISSIVIMMLSDWRLAIPCILWIVCYLGFLKIFIPRLLLLSKEASEERSVLVARIVDSYTNILTVKLFARSVDEDAYVRQAMDGYQDANARHTRCLSYYLCALQALNALFITSTAVLSITLWFHGAISAAVVTTAIPLV